MRTQSSLSVVALSHLYPSAAYPGLGPFVRDEMAEHARRHRIAVVAPLPWHPRRRSEEARRIAVVPRVAVEDGVRVVRPQLPGIPIGGRVIEPCLWARRLPPLLEEVRREINGQLVHAHFALPDGFAAARFAARADLPLVLTVWGSDVLILGNQVISRSFLRRTFDRAQAIIAVSEELAERVQQLGAAADRVQVIVGGVPYRPREPRDETRARLDIPEGTICVVWVAALISRKQPMDVIRAFEQFAAAIDADTRLVMIGEGPLRGALSEIIRERGLENRVRMLGYCAREEVWSWQCAADLVVNSSRVEGTPLSVLEALGAGTPVASYPLPGVRAAVHAVDGGCIAEEAKPAALAAAMAAVVAADRDHDALATATRGTFEIERTAQAVESVYTAVL